LREHPDFDARAATNADHAGSVAALFPGQGSQTPDMREQVERWWPELGQAAVEELGDDPFDRLADGTAFAQPAIFCASLAGWRATLTTLEPTAVSGHSLGELAALVAAGSLDPFDALRLVVVRGRLMQEVEETAGTGGMVAVGGEGLDRVPELAAAAGLVVANDNAPHQVVLSGPDAGIDTFLELAPTHRLRALRLPVGGAFHSPMMSGAVERFRRALADVPVRRPRLLAVCSSTVAPFDDVREELALGIVRPVRWRQTVEQLRRAGCTRLIEVGPGRVLTRLAKRTYNGAVDALTIEDVGLASA
jgi:[acyl-carrier-protein] S-malonyltransferase